jgi:multisubunit Na+/H+ antiporter MnhE subunit
MLRQYLQIRDNQFCILNNLIILKPTCTVDTAQFDQPVLFVQLARFDDLVAVIDDSLLSSGM